MSASKKVFFVSLGLLVLAGFALAAYNLFFKSSTQPAQRDNQNNAAGFSAKPISQEKALALALDTDNKTIKYYLANSGHVVKSQFDGSLTSVVSSTDLPGLSQMIWSPDRQKVIGVFQDQGASKKTFYDYTTKKASTLSPSIKAFAWSPDSQKIAYQYEPQDMSANTISIANADGTNYKNILPTRLKDLVVFWPSPNLIYIQTSPSAKIQGNIFSLAVDSGNISQILSGLFGLDARFSPDGQKMIYQTTDQNGKNLQLFVASANGQNAQKLPVVTLAQKCVWSSDSANIFCAAPQSISSAVVWPDDYDQGRVLGKDDIYMIDTSTLQATKIASSDATNSFDAQNLVISPAGDYIFFINNRDGLVWNVNLTLK